MKTEKLGKKYDFINLWISTAPLTKLFELTINSGDLILEKQNYCLKMPFFFACKRDEIHTINKKKRLKTKKIHVRILILSQLSE